jgi:hypothetical protein
MLLALVAWYFIGVIAVPLLTVRLLLPEARLIVGAFCIATALVVAALSQPSDDLAFTL